MLVSRTPSAFVCLRCELHLGRPRIPTYARRLSHANFSTSTRRRDGTDELEALSQAQQPGPRITKEVQPLNRLRRRKGKVIKETSAKLSGLKRLGDDAEILVLREVGDATPEEPLAKPDKVELLEVPNIHASLQEDRNLTPEEIHKQIESLRPKTHADPDEPHYVTQTTFVKLIRLLTDGFTQSQLSAFYSVAKNIQEEKVYKEVINGLKGDKGTIRSPIERTEWQPGTTPIYKRLPGLDHKHFRSKRKVVSKPLLVDRILRDVWNLVLLEEIEAPGELELSLKPWQITLLNAGDNGTALKKIGRIRRAKLEISKKHNVLRITADKTTAEYAANDVEEALQNAEVKRLQLKPWLPSLAHEKLPKDSKLVSLYSQVDLDMVTKLTRTSIQESSEDTLTIRGLDKNAVEEAARTLVKLLPLKDSSTRTVDSQNLDATKGSSYLLPIYQEEQSLDLTFRDHNVGRWTLPIVKTAESSRNEDQEQHEQPAKESIWTAHALHDHANRAVASIKRLADEVPKPREVGNWIPDPEYKLSAEFGQLLFPLDHASVNEAVEATACQSSQSPFLPSFPGLSSLLTSPDFSATTRMQSPSLVYDFVAAPKQANLETGLTFPTLHIQMRTGRNGTKATLHKLSLGFQQHVHDVLLPEKAADIRFFRYGRLRFRKSHQDRSVQEWTDTVVDNIESGGRLSAPSLRIEVPKWTISGYAPDAKGMCAVTYLFSGIQFRQSVTGQFLGTDVAYSTAQSGKLGAKGGFLNLFYAAGDLHRDFLLHDETSLNAFAVKCFAMVDKVTEASAQTLPVSKVLSPRNENSGRKLKRSGQGTAAFTPADSSIATKEDRLDRAIQNWEEQVQLETNEVNHEQRVPTAANGTQPHSTNVQRDAVEHTTMLATDVPSAPSTDSLAVEENGIDEAKDLDGQPPKPSF
ncbi:mitochondrial inner-membrane-bound regulator-domain-containing protein [Pyrenochaeta sp. MPI-SDFR-AT-0127]|nr:mitochondrial inner-membrane-bound regulator-domain-containing protein [Pyrenochaeta sp. MPI-SDFR-AT-0127]